MFKVLTRILITEYCFNIPKHNANKAEPCTPIQNKHVQPA